MPTKPTIDRLILAGITDGEFRKEDLVGLSRLSPFLYLGGTKTSQATVGGYYGCPALAQFRVAVRQVSPFPEHGTKVRESKCPHPCSDACVALPNMFDLDTRNLYFGQLNVSPNDSAFSVGYKKGGYGVKGLPMRLQQVHFRAFYPRGQSDEYAAYFLASNPVGPYKAKGTTVVLPAVVIDSDFELQLGSSDPNVPGEPSASEHLYWTQNSWAYSGKEQDAIYNHEGRLIMGDPLGVQEGEMDGYGVQQPLQWQGMYECYDSFSSPKNQVYRMILDGEGFIIRQTKLNYDKLGHAPTKGKPGYTANGWGYEIPMDVIISNRYRFHGSEDSYDHIVMEYYPGDEWDTEKLLLRPPPQTDTVIGCKSLERGWEAIQVMNLEDFADLFPRVVTCVENRGDGLWENYADISYDNGGLLIERGSREIIPFTACDGSLTPKKGSCASDELPSRTPDPSASATPDDPSPEYACPYPESSTRPCPDRNPDNCGDCDQVC